VSPREPESSCASPARIRLRSVIQLPHYLLSENFGQIKSRIVIDSPTALPHPVKVEDTDEKRKQRAEGEMSIGRFVKWSVDRWEAAKLRARGFPILGSSYAKARSILWRASVPAS
jgi:hypothetical protein